MEGKRYRWIWWILGVLLVVGLIWYGVARRHSDEYMDGTLVWKPMEVLCINEPETCDLYVMLQPATYDGGGLEVCQKPYI